MTEMEQPQAEEPDAGDGCWRDLRAAFLCDCHRPRTSWYAAPRFRFPLQPLQVGAHLRGVLVAQVAIFLQRLVDDVFQLGRKVGIQPHRGNRVRDSESRRRSPPELSPRKGNVPGRHLVEHGAEREQIGARVQLFRPRLLRRHVGDRAQRRARTGQVLLVHASGRVAPTLPGSTNCAAGVTFASPKSRILACPRLVTKMLAGLMSRWTMPSAWAASSASAISMASDSSSLGLQRPARDAVLQRHAVQKLHGDERLAVLLADVVDRADVGMVQRGGGLRLALEAAQEPAGRWRRRRAGTSARQSGRSVVSSAL